MLQALSYRHKYIVCISSHVFTYLNLTLDNYINYYQLQVEIKLPFINFRRRKNPSYPPNRGISVRFCSCSISRGKRIKDVRTLPVSTMRGKTSWIYKMATDFFHALAWPTCRETFSAIIRLSVSSPRILPTVNPTSETISFKDTL